MRTLFNTLFLSLFFSISYLEINAQRLDRFGSATGSINNEGTIDRIAYKKIAGYFDYFNSTKLTDTLQKGQPVCYLYFWIDDTMNEIGLRIVSPVPLEVMPDRGDFETPEYELKAEDKTRYFDTYISLERSLNAFKKGDLNNMFSIKDWMLIGSNDDSEELFTQPSGKKTNSLFRIVDKPKSSKNKLVPGLYRVGISDFKNKNGSGYFVLQIGFTEKQGGLKIVKSIKELAE